MYQQPTTVPVSTSITWAINFKLRAVTPGAFFSKVPRTFRAQKASCQTAIFNVRKTMRIVKFDGLELQRREDVKGIVAPERGQKGFGTLEKQAPEPKQLSLRNLIPELHFHSVTSCYS